MADPDPMQFSADVSRWCDGQKARAEEAFLAIGYAVLREVREKTPVRTGWLRANWQIVIKGEAVGMTKPAGGEREHTAFSAQGTAPASAASGLTMTLRGRVELGDVIQIVNPVAYAAPIEFGREIQKKDGSITHVPGRGMVQQTMADLPRIAAQAIADLEKKSP